MKTIVVVILTALLLFSCSNNDFSKKPTLNNGKKWRIGYYEGGEYYDYKGWFLATIKGLMTLGWIETANIPVNKDDHTEDIWKWLTTKMKSNFITFVDDGYYSAHWDNNLRFQIKEDIINRLNTQKDIDLILAFGTWAGKDLANNYHNIPTLILSASDPIKAGIIRNYNNSGFDHIHAHVDRSLYNRQVLIFYTATHFKKLGIAYENTVNGRSYAAIDTINAIAKQRQFEVVPCYTKSDIVDKIEAENSVLKCVETLSEKVDALYLTQQGGVNSNTIPKIVEIANNKGIPTFSQAGSQEVKDGVLMSISNSGFKYVGQYHAGIIAKILNGAKPRQLKQVFEGPIKVALNLETAKKVGLSHNTHLLNIADEIYK